MVPLIGGGVMAPPLPINRQVWPPPHVLAAQMSLIRMAKVFKGRLVGLFDEHCGLLAGRFNPG